MKTLDAMIWRVSEAAAQAFLTHPLIAIAVAVLVVAAFDGPTP